MKTQRSPLSIAMKSNRRGQPDPFTFVSLNSFNSSWREEEGGCKTNERSEQRSSFCPRNKSMSSKDSQCRQQRLTSSPHFMTKDTWMLAKRRRRRRGMSLSFFDEFQICKKGRWHMFVAADDLTGRHCIFEITLRKVWQRNRCGDRKKMTLQGGGKHWQQVQHGKAGSILVLYCRSVTWRKESLERTDGEQRKV